MLTPNQPSTSAIIDNRIRRVGDFLRSRIDRSSELSIVSAYFTIYAFDRMSGALSQAAATRFLYGDPAGVGSVDPSDGAAKEFGLADHGGIALQKVLSQKALARECADWIRDRVEIRTVERAGFLHGKLYHIKKNGRSSATVAGSSNFTVRGLGFSSRPNIELNLEVGSETDRDELLRWFDELWCDTDTTRDVKDEVLAALERLGKPNSPEFVYYKTLFHVFEDKLKNRSAQDELLHDVHLHDTEIWRKLYEFQKHGATTAINRLLQYNGCIIADSVGLGKTWTALAVIKFFELRNERVLVLCPKKLEDNWVRYVAWAGSSKNPFLKDRLNYTVLAHTDLSREQGSSGKINLADFNWGSFDLVVIDESHNFRNEGIDRRNEQGIVIRRSRFSRLLEDVIKDGMRTKVLMLSATPVNTSLRDLRNQIYLMTEKQVDAFSETLGISNIQSVFAIAEKKFRQWEVARRLGERKDKANLIEELGPDFLSLLDAVTIARSRAHLRKYYPELNAQIGGFPQRKPPNNLYPATDLNGELSYDDLHRRIRAFRLAVYMPSKYVKDQSALEDERKKHRFDQREREHWLVAMICTNLLKRLESSVHSFTRTMNRILNKMDNLHIAIEKWEETQHDQVIEQAPDPDEEDDEFIVGNRRQYRLSEIDVNRWKKDLRDDRKNFAQIHEQASHVTPDRDAKLKDLITILAHKIQEPTCDKDGRLNRKVLVFTTFTDTAEYLLENVRKSHICKELHARVELVVGGDGNARSAGESKFEKTLGRFAPIAQGQSVTSDEVDILIATDCISEGQNLQDCDLVVNYDIHWNPVRLMQRFGRIDRLGSRNEAIWMVNFWPTKDLNCYLDLQNRVEARMVLADATATGVDNLLEEQVETKEGVKDAVQGELKFRDMQLIRLRDETLDIEDMQDGVSLNDLTLDDFVADLLRYLEKNRDALEAAPLGIYAVSDSSWSVRARVPTGISGQPIRPGVLFCFRQKTALNERSPNLLQSYFLLYVQKDGTVRIGFQRAKQCLALFRALTTGREHPVLVLENAFDMETDHGRQMEKYDKLVHAAVRDIVGRFRTAQLQHLMRDPEARLARISERPATENLELVTWLNVMDEPPTPRRGAAGDHKDRYPRTAMLK